jgi:Tfp pilus assembly protein PilX
MKSILTPQREQGTVLVTTLVMSMLIAIVIAALLFVAQQHNQMTARSRVWSSEIPLAEAGVEEAMALINSRPSTLQSEGWQRINSTNFWKRREFTNAYFHATILPSSASLSAATNTIVSIGFARVPLRTNYTRRTVVAIAKLGPPDFGIVSKTTISMNGNPYIDSYDSSDPRFSTNGVYDPTKRRDRAGVATTSSLSPAIDTGGGDIYGSAATGPGGTVSGDVGDGAWLASGGTGSQPGHVTDDYNAAITDVALPSPWNPNLIALPRIIDGVTYAHGLSAGDWQFNTDVSGSIYVEGKVRVYFRRDFKISGGTAIRLAPGATLEMYMGGDMDLSGSAIINTAGIPANCTIYGLPTCRSIKYSGGAEIIAKLYAPQADIRISGDFDFSGSMVGNSIRLSGNCAVHYDEALGGDGPDYKIVSWEEL